MKELTIEQKAQRYDEAIKKAKGVIEQNPLMEYLKKGIEYIFPELKESEGEKIRKALMQNLKERFGTKGTMGKGLDMPDVLAWLEKQGEQKPAEVEPKFKVGDWVVYDHRPYQVVELPKEGYINLGLKGNGKIEFAPSPYCRHWTIKDANDGDILSYENEIFIVKKSVNINILYYCCYDREHFIIDSFYSLTIDDIDNITPATKEQRNALMKAMADAGYTFDFKEKVLKKIEKMSVERSEEEIENCAREAEDNNCIILAKHIRQLKSLRPQSTWTPSDEQLDSLYDVLNPCDGFNREVLESLYVQLKKLRKE